MRAAVQRVLQASVSVDAQLVARIDKGLLVYVGFGGDDDRGDLDYIVDKLLHLRIFQDHAGRMNIDILQQAGQMLVVSAFTLQADARKGRRPSFDAAGPPEAAQERYQEFCEQLARHLPIEQGRFGAYMHVSSVNDGPICILLDSEKKF